ncbi:MAG: glucokinase [Gammaproteobacteria bacterium]|nr:glucokinase [Gammaproteobacteria bacterium]
MQVLAGDIGGTTTRLIAAVINDGKQQIIAEESYPSADYNGLIQAIDRFLSQHAITTPIHAACFAVAGPVEAGVSAVTNLPWVISEKQLSQHLKTSRISLINDFVAAAYGISTLGEDDTLMLQQGLAGNRTGTPPAVVIGAGTGLGVSHRVWLDDRYQAFPSEAGHAGFAPENAGQTRLLAWLQKQHAHVSLEMLLSGQGLVTIYRFLHEVAGLPDTLGLANNKVGSKGDDSVDSPQQADHARLITEQALLEKDDLCQQTLNIFIDIYGAAASNVALHYYPVDELYIAGGIAPKIKTKMAEPRFIQAFLNKGVMSDNMKKITIKLIIQDKVGLYGALAQAQALIRDR